MPWCPKCHSEYRPETTVCPDCEEELSDAPIVLSASAPRWPPSNLLRVLAAMGVSFLLFWVFLLPAYLLFDWLMMNGLCTMRGEEMFVYCPMLAAAPAGFFTGALLNKLIRPVHVYAAGTVLGIVFTCWALATVGSFGWLWPTISEFLREILAPMLVLPQLVAVTATARGIEFGRGQRLKSSVWLICFLAILFGAMLSMRPLFDLVSK